MKHKLIQTDKGLLLLDLEGTINEGCYFLNENNELCQWTSKVFNSILKTKVIASSYIDELPKISQSIEEIREMIKDKEIEDLYYSELSLIIGDKPSVKDDVISFYKSNKSEYSREQMKIAYEDSCKYASFNDLLESLELKIDSFVEVADLWVRSEIQYSITKIL